MVPDSELVHPSESVKVTSPSQLFNIPLKRLLTVDDELLSFNQAYRKIEAMELKVLSQTQY